MTSTNIDSGAIQISFEFSEQEQVKAWERAKARGPAAYQQLIYLNSLIEQVITPYIQSSYQGAETEQDLSQLPDLGINGVSFSLGTGRLVILPSDDLDRDELTVPQEWINSSLRADILIAAHVDLEERLILLWGYTTHRQVRLKGEKRFHNRTYGMNESELTPRLSALWLQLKFHPDSLLQQEAVTVPQVSLTLDHLTNLIEDSRSGQISDPRLSIPEPEWNQIVANARWRQQLLAPSLNLDRDSNNRQSQVRFTALRDWLNQRATAVMQGWTTLAQPGGPIPLDFQFLNAQDLVETQRVKVFTLGTAVNQHSLSIFITLSLRADQRLQVQIQLQPTQTQMVLPMGLELALLDHQGSEVERVIAHENDNWIRLSQFQGEVGEQFQLALRLMDGETQVAAITEHFVL